MILSIEILMHMNEKRTHTLHTYTDTQQEGKS